MACARQASPLELFAEVTTHVHDYFPSLAHVLVSPIALLLQFRPAEPVHPEGKDGGVEDDVGNVATGGVEGLFGDFSSAVPLLDVLVLGQPSGTHAHAAAVNECI